MNDEERYRRYFELFNKWLYLRNNKISIFADTRLKEKSVAIYGLGNTGRRLVEEFELEGQVISYIVDREADNLFSEYAIYSPEDDLPFAEIMIFSLICDYETTVPPLAQYFKGKILCLENIINDLWRKELVE